MSEQEPRNRKERRAAAREAAREAKRARRRRSDDERREAMRRLDAQTPLKPNRGDLIIGARAEQELERLRGLDTLKHGGRRG